jgi:uncharacterized protein YyaL (SSP411 family)
MIMAKKTNQLASSLSPYLLQHQFNPVNWYPWQDEAIKRAQQEDKPIFLSIGYSACHWCHVMEKESFEDDLIANILNDHFISIKVDREERPDLDHIYMSCLQAMSGHGGWPMSIFMTSQLKPFYAGTYFPPTAQYGLPAFSSLLLQIVEAWKHHRDSLVESSQAVFDYLQQEDHSDPADPRCLKKDIFTSLAAACYKTYDSHWGGFGVAPKFPQASVLLSLIQHQYRQPNAQMLEMINYTLEQMAQGGIYDQIGGGFHRYSVDKQWLVPHFEKMLYDNALLSHLYLEAYQLTKNEDFLDTALNTLQYLLREMRDPLGGFYSAEDADSEGKEGKFYLWSFAEIEENLPDSSLFCLVYGVSKQGNFEQKNLLHQVKSIHSLTPKEKEQLLSDQQILLKIRSQRVKPHLDDKVLVDWNALTISSLAKAYQITKQNCFLEAAQKAAFFIANHMTKENRLFHLWRENLGLTEGFLEDYANYILALIDLYESDFNLDWILKAKNTLETMIELFWDPKDKAFFATSKKHSYLIVRKKIFHDEATPAGNAQAALALLRMSSFYDELKYHEMAESILYQRANQMHKAPKSYGTMLRAVDRYLFSSKQIVLTGCQEDQQFQNLLKMIHTTYLPQSTLAFSDDSSSKILPLCKGKTSLNNQALICYQGICLPSVTDLTQLHDLLQD